MARKRRTTLPVPVGYMPVENGMNEKLHVTNKKPNAAKEKSNAPSQKPRGSRSTTHPPKNPSTRFNTLFALALLPVLCLPIILVFWGFQAFFRVLTMPIRIPYKIPIVIYLTCAIFLGATASLFVGSLTVLFARCLGCICPCLRRRQRKRPSQPATKPLFPPKRHAASAVTWSSDESGDLPGPLIPPPRRFHGPTIKEAKPKPASKAKKATGPPTTGPSTWSRDSRHRTQQSAKVRVEDTIHEESSSLSDDRPKRNRF
ncbi:predicted protein [Chaetomium globosum CBS 148.51]|uniref:Uncharacterized protein n=1 Tax=Chaetomium globosum (strain ATCC 6205 / CBS 148.51 / DSM 1962 / NBRC 6347 / NRRL 1970) TaxID=306901 RepID=Q2GW68_CHAGB|nr:uncharacterized protein CHGG_07786 [Chaetomium globosum CBS 148.51]EAQ86533.1 predicted protein [Chaetomium globosum CBS 148.51]